MAINTLLERKIKKFTRDEIDEFEIVSCCASIGADPEEIIEKIKDFVRQFGNKSHLEYVLRKILQYLDTVNFTESNSYASYNVESLKSFKENLDEIKDYIILELDFLDINLDDEMYSKEEFDNLLHKIDSISEMLFDFQKRNEAAYEVIYNSVDEIKNELKASAEKGKVFGKEFVEQYLTGKIMDMAFKGSMFALLSQAPEKISELSEHIEKLL
ncbi:hypothetical protein [Sphingobacterium thalpophilum]|uniref:hypothetical protein n=1 Tax=Sphingobacterium thalpophilum TaxID=259 RepID=UPI0024A70823|nr:hypothetical protein [Sphingobacterium thalpophilum]